MSVKTPILYEKVKQSLFIYEIFKSKLHQIYGDFDVLCENMLRIVANYYHLGSKIPKIKVINDLCIDFCDNLFALTHKDLDLDNQVMVKLAEEYDKWFEYEHKKLTEATELIKKINKEVTKQVEESEKERIKNVYGNAFIIELEKRYHKILVIEGLYNDEEIKEIRHFYKDNPELIDEFNSCRMKMRKILSERPNIIPLLKEYCDDVWKNLVVEGKMTEEEIQSYWRDKI